MGQAVTLPGAGPNGETIVAENETAVDLYLFKHDLPGYERPTPKTAAVPPKGDPPLRKELCPPAGERRRAYLGNGRGTHATITRLTIRSNRSPAR
ncbi:MAG TPA: hypothetical protein VGQ28_13055 [Thermoanaerobaculia bacterium]|jgi:hypothetical protein|nr:hypothetical protein [Thermoanaerobaculia bacterium]